MNKTIFIKLSFFLILYCSCTKEKNLVDSKQQSKNYKVTSVDIETTIDLNIILIKKYLTIISKSLVGLMNDSIFKNAVYSEVVKRNMNNEYAVSFDSLLAYYNRNHLDLVEALSQSLKNFGGSESMIDTLESAIISFSINSIKFTPKIFIPILYTNCFDIGNWNKKDFLYIAISQFNIPGNLPTYRQGDSLSVTYRNSSYVFVRPTWYVCVSLNIANELFNQRIVERIRQPGEHNCVCRNSMTGGLPFCDFDWYPGGIGDCSGVLRPDGECEDVCMYTFRYDILPSY
ncbi:MAG: hypothetical protein K0B15_17065 [Lentimicrobium sp.]|nr:hypothetical protein [Lentimicrobium sp.]